MEDRSMAPTKPSIAYTGTGEPLYACSIVSGNDLWKSIEAGMIWKHISLEKSHFIVRVQVDHKNPDTVHAATEGELFYN